MSLVIGSLLVFAQSSAAAVPAPAPVKEKKICRADQTTGSRMATRTCHTKAEWNAIDQASLQKLEDRR